MCAVYALFGVVLIPISFLAIRISRSIIHPEVFTRHGPQMTGWPVPHLLRLLARDAVPVRDAVPDRARRQAARLAARRELRELLDGAEAEAPARRAGSGADELKHRCAEEMTPSRSTPPPRIWSSSSGVLAYVLIIASKLQRLQRQVGDSSSRCATGPRERRRGREWLSSSSGRRCSATARRRSPTATRATRGSRPGASGSAGSPRRRCSASRRRGSTRFPWSSWAGSLNLFVWLVVGAYLFWGCQQRYRLVGLGGDAARGAALRRRPGRRRHDGGRALALLEPLPDRARRLRARRVRRLHAWRRCSRCSTCSRSAACSVARRTSCG